MNRRQFLKTASTAALAGAAPLHAKERVNDVTQLNPVYVAKVVRPSSLQQLASELRGWSGPVSIGGGRFSMGGQIAAPQSLHIDMRSLRRVVEFSPERKVVRVQGGTTWRDLQDLIDPHGLSISIMQSYSNFTVGGSVSVNCHGRYLGRGPVVNSVASLRLMKVDGESLDLAPRDDAELFNAVCGGYGGLGIITEVEIALEDNEPLERFVDRVSLENYPEFFRARVASNPQVVLHSANLTPPDFATPVALTWQRTSRPLTEPQRLIPRDADYAREKNAIWAITELPGGNALRDRVEKSVLDKPAVVWRNYEASLDVASLEPRTRLISSYLLQEYFIPVAKFKAFASDMARILKARQVNALNVSIRHSPADSNTVMKWAPTEVFSFVLYYKQRSNQTASVSVRDWTRELIDAALENGGRYYLPYRLDATLDQFRRAYPEWQQFSLIKRRVDPGNRMRNMLWDRYLA